MSFLTRSYILKQFMLLSVCTMSCFIYVTNSPDIERSFLWGPHECARHNLLGHLLFQIMDFCFKAVVLFWPVLGYNGHSLACTLNKQQSSHYKMYKMKVIYCSCHSYIITLHILNYRHLCACVRANRWAHTCIYTHRE
jgi:hypothetical protein